MQIFTLNLSITVIVKKFSGTIINVGDAGIEGHVLLPNFISQGLIVNSVYIHVLVRLVSLG